MSENYKKFIKKWKYEVTIDKDDKLHFDLKPPYKKVAPNSLYKYFSLSKNSLNVLLNNEIFAAHPLNLNDPFDCYHDLVDYSNLPEDDINDYIDEFGVEGLQINSREDRLRFLSMGHYMGMFSRLGIISLCEDYLNMLMWAYYSSNHSGFAIEFSTTEFDNRFHGPFPIHYSDDFEQIDFKEYTPYISLLYQITLKSCNWSHEQEWRFLAERPHMGVPGFYEPANLNKRTFDFGQNTIKRIIFGYNFFNFLIQHEFPTTVERTIEFKETGEQLSIKNSLLDFVKSHNIPTEIVTIKRKGNFELDTREIIYDKITEKKYNIKIKKNVP